MSNRSCVLKHTVKGKYYESFDEHINMCSRFKFLRVIFQPIKNYDPDYPPVIKFDCGSFSHFFLADHKKEYILPDNELKNKQIREAPNVLAEDKRINIKICTHAQNEDLEYNIYIEYEWISFF